MKPRIGLPLILTVAAGAGLVISAPNWLPTVGQWLSQGSRLLTASGGTDVITAESYQAQLREAAERRAKDPAWKPACHELTAIQIGDPTRPGALRNYALKRRRDSGLCRPNPGRGTRDGRRRRAGLFPGPRCRGRPPRVLPGGPAPTDLAAGH